MNKTDKLLYEGFGVVALAVIVAMLVSVFSPPKQTAEETVKTPRIEVGTAKSINAPNQMRQWRQGVENDRRQREQDEALAEFLKNNPEIAKLIQAEEAEKQAKEEAERPEKEWWESRQDWVERFPFEPTHHPEITYDPTAYDPSRVREWPEEKKDDAYWKMLEMVDNHSFLRRFYESRLPHTEEFEQMHDIITEEVGEKAENTVMMGWAFDVLKDYHLAKAKDPDAIYRKNAQVYQPQPPPQNPPSVLDGLTPEQLAAYKALPGAVRREMTAEIREERSQEMRKRIKSFHASQRYQTVDITWGERTEREKEYILGSLMRHVQPGQPWLSREQAIRIQERLLNEIPGEGFLEMSKENLCYVHRYKRELKPGDPLLIK